jgi:hypothetical protein
VVCHLPQFKDRLIDDALLEATLVHLRLLDDFLASKGRHPLQVHAKDWISQSDWKPKDWLKDDVRRRINGQVAHLSKDRDPWFDWDIRGYAHSCCRERLRSSRQ